MTPKDAADGFVIFAAVKIAWISLAIIFEGTEPFLAGAAFTANALFAEMYFRPEEYERPV